MSPRKRRKPASTDEAKRAAEIKPVDVEHARATWRRDAPAAFRALLDAPPAGKTESKPADII